MLLVSTYMHDGSVVCRFEKCDGMQQDICMLEAHGRTYFAMDPFPDPSLLGPTALTQPGRHSHTKAAVKETVRRDGHAWRHAARMARWKGASKAKEKRLLR